jgi:hypothetical protein
MSRFVQEAKTAAAFRAGSFGHQRAQLSEHPDHLRHRCDFSREWGAPYIVAELLEGDELRAKLNDGAITPRKAVERSNSAGAGEQHSSSEGMKLLEKHTVPRSAGMSYHMPVAQRSRKLLPIRVAPQDYRHFQR